MADLLAGAPTPWERLPEAGRTLTFRATARDNRAGGGGVDYDTMVLTVSGNPFAVTVPAAGGSLECGDSAALAWQVGGGAVSPDLRALLSVDGGLTFVELLASTPNDGAETVPVPRTLAPSARLKLEALGNVFFALSGGLSVEDTRAPAVTAPPDAGIDPIHFAMVVIYNLTLGMITPPVGGLLFVTSAVTRVPLPQLARELNPFMLAHLAVLLLITLVPSVSTWLPAVSGLAVK